MADYVGKICKNCKKPISYLDEVVVCYCCENAYHKACTTNGLCNKCSIPVFITSQNDETEIEKINSNKSPVAHQLKVVGYIIMVLFTVGGGVGSCFVGPEIEYSYFRDYPIFYVLAFAIGAVVGYGLGFLVSLFIRFLAELGENVSKQTTVEQAPKSAPQELLEYNELLKSGIITQEEFDAKKKEILNL